MISVIQKESGGHCFVAGLDKTVPHSLLVEDPLVRRNKDFHYSGERSPCCRYGDSRGQNRLVDHHAWEKRRRLVGPPDLAKRKVM